MSHAIVTLEITPSQRVDLALPLNIANQVLAPTVAKALEMSESDMEAFLFSVKTENGIVRLGPETTLAEAGVLDGFILQLQRKSQKEKERVQVNDSDEMSYLETPSGERFALKGESTSVGRRDIKRGSLVDIDLTPLDTGKIVSRRHAIIEQQGGKFLLKDLDSINGTWVNNERIDPRQPYTLRKGDVITFGKNGVQLKYDRE